MYWKKGGTGHRFDILFRFGFGEIMAKDKCPIELTPSINCEYTPWENKFMKLPPVCYTR